MKVIDIIVLLGILLTVTVLLVLAERENDLLWERLIIIEESVESHNRRLNTLEQNHATALAFERLMRGENVRLIPSKYK